MANRLKVLNIFLKINSISLLFCYKTIIFAQNNFGLIRINSFFNSKDIKLDYFQTGLFGQEFDHDLFIGVKNNRFYKLKKNHVFDPGIDLKIFFKKPAKELSKSKSKYKIVGNEEDRDDKLIKKQALLGLEFIFDFRFRSHINTNLKKIWLDSVTLMLYFLGDRLNKCDYKNLLEILYTRVEPKLKSRLSYNYFSSWSNTIISFVNSEPFLWFFRHQPIIESFLFTSETSLNLDLWKKNQIKKFSILLLSAGFRAKDVKKTWSELNKKVKKNFLTFLFRECRKAGMVNFFNPVLIAIFQDNIETGSRWMLTSHDLALILKLLLDFNCFVSRVCYIRLNFIDSLKSIWDKDCLQMLVSGCKSKTKLFIRLANQIVGKELYKIQYGVVETFLKYNEKLTFFVIKGLLVYGTKILIKKGILIDSFSIKVTLGSYILHGVSFQGRTQKRRRKDQIMNFYQNKAIIIYDRGLLFFYIIEKPIQNYYSI